MFCTFYFCRRRDLNPGRPRSKQVHNAIVEDTKKSLHGSFLSEEPLAKIGAEGRELLECGVREGRCERLPPVGDLAPLDDRPPVAAHHGLDEMGLAGLAALREVPGGHNERYEPT